ncbi:MAG TPA: RAMP superfamily CRISPR-associated protein [Kofleriaceae bacterium]|nr:RAMP superfamily CRISPR-associated protein [Kofleriaceae bacterium]
MRAFDLIVRFPGGGPLIGGAAVTPPGFHASHARLRDREPNDGKPGDDEPYEGKPYLPATALRGALRESFEALLRGTGEHRACAGGDGIDPEPGDPDAGAAAGAARACTLGGDGTPCLACRLFGTQRASIGCTERAFSGLVLGDAALVGSHRWTARPSVALARASRSAADQQLVFRRIPEATGDGPLTFRAEGRVNEASLEPYFDAAARATTHLGAGRSRGLARVKVAVEWHDAPPASKPPALPASSGDVRIRVTLRAPALIGASIIDANYRETRHEIPGAAVRGAIGFALRALVPDADRDPATQDLLDAERGARFGFLYPAGPMRDERKDRISGPMPITATWCKGDPWNHGVRDTLFDRLALLHAASAAEAERVARPAAMPCPRCDRPMRTAHRSRLASAPVETRTIVRVAMDRARQSARDGQLFSQVLLAPGTVLEGTIRGIPTHSRSRLAQALGSGIVSFGRGPSAGWGQACIDIESARPLPSIADRAAAFDRALRDRLQAAGLTSDRIGRLVPVTLWSPLWPSDPDRDPTDAEDGARELCAAVGAAGCYLAARRFARDGAWDQRTGKMSTFRATAAGGVFVLELAQATWRDVVPRLEALERDGVGQRRDQGFGQVLCFDPHFRISSQNG